MDPSPAVGARTVYRTCNLCEAHCGVEVAGGAGRAVRGDPDDALSRAD